MSLLTSQAHQHNCPTTKLLQLLKSDLSCYFDLPLAHADYILFFYSYNGVESIGVIIVRFTHVVAKFIRFMSHNVTYNDLIGLLKLCSASRAQHIHDLNLNK